jgi:exopolysaccharide biosynthesis polyprenyl glycosylphosphotransferase
MEMAERSSDVQLGNVLFLPRGEGVTADVAPPHASAVLTRYRRIARWMGVTDALALATATTVAYLLVPARMIDIPDAVAVIALYPVAQVATFACFHLYAAHQIPASEQFRRLLLAMAVGVSAVVVLSFWSDRSVARASIALIWSLGIVLVGADRLLWNRRVAASRRSGQLQLRTIIVGTNEEARRLARGMRKEPRQGFQPIGFVSIDRHMVAFDGLPVLGALADTVEVIRASDADCVFVASSAVRVEHTSWLARALRPQDVEVRFSTNLPELLISRLSLHPVARIPSLRVRPARLTGPQALAKRATDVIVSLVLLVVTAPLMAAVAFAVKFSSRGPVLFRQERIGREGRPFVMLKFRTMVADAQERLADVRPLNDVPGPLFKMRRDPRATRVGRWLRRHSLDELPQLVNVVRGDMSLVGPRPPLRSEVSVYERWHFARLEVRPGMTGLWQVAGRSDRSFDDMVRLDVFYIENWSLSQDLIIAARTIPALIRARGAY